VNFNSHTDRVVAVDGSLVNTLTPGEARGHSYAGPTGPDLRRAATSVLRMASPRTPIFPTMKPSSWGEPPAAVFAGVATGDVDAAARRSTI
jgi:hypothetical protein